MKPSGDRQWRHPVVRSLSLLFLVLLLALFGPSLMVFNQVLDSLQTEVMASMKARVGSVAGYFDRELTRISDLMDTFRNDPDLLRLAIIPESLTSIERTEVVLRIAWRLATVKSSSPLVGDIIIVVPQIGRYIDSTGAGSLSNAAIEHVKSLAAKTTHGVVEDGGELKLVAADSTYVVLATVSAEASRSVLERYTTAPGESSRLVHLGGSLVITSRAVTSSSADEPAIEVSAVSETGRIQISNRILESIVFRSVSPYRLWFVAQLLLLILVGLLYYVYLIRLLQRPIHQLVKAFEQIDGGVLEFAIEHKPDDEFQFIYSRFNTTTKNLRTLIDQNVELGLRTKQAELSQLQAQINPHFLYNSFLVLESMAAVGDWDQAQQFSRHLAGYFEFLTGSHRSNVPLEQELEHARLYLEIQQARFPGRIVTSFAACPPSWATIIVPRLLIQPLVENAFEHGVERTPGPGKVEVSLEDHSTWVEVIVEDSGGLLSDEVLQNLRERNSSPSAPTDITGVVNIHRRLQLAIAPTSGLSFDRSHLGGLKVTVRIDRGG